MGKRKGSKNGIITQKMVCFKLDLDLLETWNNISNKSEWINNQLRTHKNWFYKKESETKKDAQ